MTRQRMKVAALAALTLGAIGVPATASAGAPSAASIIMTQTVMVDAGDICGTESTISVTAGTTVRFCYTATNNGTEPLDLHTVFGSFDGTVLTDFSFTLNPGLSTFITSAEVVNATVTNEGTWMASGDAGSDQFSSSATVNVVSTQHSADGSVTAVVNALSACTLNILVTVSDEGDPADPAPNFTVGNTVKPAGVDFSDVATYIGFPEGSFAFDNFDVALGASLNGTYTFTVTKFAGDGTAGITNPVVVSVEVANLPLCGQHSASVSLVDSSACSLDLRVAVENGGDTSSTFTVASSSQPDGVGLSNVTTYIGFGEGNFDFNNFSVDPGESLNGTYEFTITKTAGDAIAGSVNPLVVEYEVTDMPTCGARVIIEKSTVGGFGGPFQFEVREGDEGQNLIASPSGSTTAADTETEMYDEYGTAGFYSVRELFDVGDTADSSTWDAGDGFFPGQMTCTLLDADGEPITSNTADPQSTGVTGLGFRVDDGETLSCVVVNEAPGSITISKNTPDSQSSPSFEFTGDFTFDLAGGESETFDGLEEGGYEFTESAFDGWTLASVGCEGEYKYDDEEQTLYVFVGPGDTVECEFINFADEVTTTTETSTTAATTTTVDGDSGAGNPTTTRPRNLPGTGGGSSSGDMTVLALGMILAGAALVFTRRRTIH